MTANTAPRAPLIERGDGWTMIHADFASAVDSVECDVVITDPPYLGASPVGSQGGLAAAQGRASAVPRAYRQGPGAAMMEYEPATEALLDQVVSTTYAMPCAPTMLVALNDFPGIVHMQSAASAAGWKVSKQPVVWVRKRALPTGYLWRPRKDCEFALVAARTNVKGDLPCADTLPGYYECFPPAPATQHVVGQKPINLMRAFVRDYSKPGMTVFDPFAGSGTTGVAALLEGRAFVGCEVDPGRFALCCERLSAPRSGTLF